MDWWPIYSMPFPQLSEHSDREKFPRSESLETLLTITHFDRQKRETHEPTIERSAVNRGLFRDEFQEPDF